jgi:hypothetical protein
MEPRYLVQYRSIVTPYYRSFALCYCAQEMPDTQYRESNLYTYEELCRSYAYKPIRTQRVEVQSELPLSVSAIFE